MRKWIIGSGVVVLLLILGGALLLTANALTPSPVDAAPQAPNTVLLASDNYGLHWQTAASGGGVTTSSHYRIASTIGQPATGQMSSSHFSHRAGFWQKWLYKVFAPFVERE